LVITAFLLLSCLALSWFDQNSNMDLHMWYNHQQDSASLCPFETPTEIDVLEHSTGRRRAEVSLHPDVDRTDAGDVIDGPIVGLVRNARTAVDQVDYASGSAAAQYDIDGDRRLYADGRSRSQ